MKRVIFISLLMVTAVWSSEPPFHSGVNLTNWFQTSSAQQIQFTKFTRQDFINIKILGCDVIRLPINLHFMTSGAPDYKVDPLFYYFLDQIVDFAEELEIHLILDNHTFDSSADTDPNIDDVHTDALNGLVLEEGVGYPFDIFVIVPIEDTLKVTHGAVFSYYEFSQPISNRLTDEAWQDTLKSDIPLKPPVWIGSFMDTSQSFINKYPFPYNTAELFTSINDRDNIFKPDEFTLKQNYPNPFNSMTTIQYQLPQSAYVTLNIYNLAGQLVETLVKERKGADYHSVQWDASNIPSGIYFYRIQSGEFQEVRKMILLK